MSGSRDIRTFVSAYERYPQSSEATARPQICPRVAAGGTCWTSNCKFSHNKEDAPICKMWQKGFCIGGRGNNCPLRHFYNEHDGPMLQSKRFQDTEIERSSTMDFSSPLRVKVVKEVSKQRREEFDLDTGKRRSWVEETEYEVLDLCGDTPDKPKLGARMEEESPGRFRSPLGNRSRNLVSNLAKEVARQEKSPRAISMPPPASPKAPVDDKECPSCHRTFKSARGVTQHRARAKSCSVDKENHLGEEAARVVDRMSSAIAGETARGPTPNPMDDSVIVIPDSPASPYSRRRSARLRSVR